MKTLTALVMTGALALGACGPTISRYDDGTVRYSDTVRYDGQKYYVTVTDNNRQSIAGSTSRSVSMVADATSGTPYVVEGSRVVESDGTYTAGKIQYSSATPDKQPAGCVWGVETSEPGYQQCKPEEIGVAAAMLDAAAKDVLN